MDLIDKERVYIFFLNMDSKSLWIKVSVARMRVKAQQRSGKEVGIVNEVSDEPNER